MVFVNNWKCWRSELEVLEEGTGSAGGGNINSLFFSVYLGAKTIHSIPHMFGDLSMNNVIYDIRKKCRSYFNRLCW
jgi:hypothetical protein